MIINRPNEIANVNAGVCSKEGDMHWVNRVDGYRGAVNGFIEFAAESFKKAWWREIDIKNAMIIKCRTLKHILQRKYDYPVEQQILIFNGGVLRNEQRFSELPLTPRSTIFLVKS